MNRRRFVSGLAAAALAPAAIGQTKARLPHVGYLRFQPRDEALIEAFRSGLANLGHVEGRNIRVTYRFADTDSRRVADLADELVRLKVDVIVVSATPAAHAAAKATRTIPILTAGIADPVATGLIRSLARPEGNITGISLNMPELAGKRLELIRELLPGASRIAYLGLETDPAARVFVRETEASAGRLGMSVQSILLQHVEGIETAFSEIGKWNADALLVQPILAGEYARIARLAISQRLPAFSDQPFFVESGGLASYGPDFAVGHARIGYYVDRILKGAKPGELPVQQPTEYRLVINGKLAQVLGITIPQSVKLRADRIIQ